MYVIQEDDNHMYPLCYACEINDIEEVKRMICNGENINIQNDKLETPLHIACRKHNIDIIEVLLEHGADPNNKDSMNNGPLHYVCMRINNVHYNIAKLLLKYRVDVEYRVDVNYKHNYNDEHQESTKIIKLLFDHGANIYSKNECEEYNKEMSAILEKEMKKRIYILSLIINRDVLKHYIAKKID